MFRRKARRAPARKSREPKRVAKLSKPLKRAIKQVVRGEAETKRVSWYQSYNDGTITTPATGFYSAAGWAVQNNRITTNNTDILRLIPLVAQGIDDWERVGNKIRPNALVVKGQVRIRQALWNNPVTVPQNLTIDLYVLQHQVFKDYNTLYANNNFTQLLDTGEGDTQAYAGVPVNTNMRVAAQNYRVLTRRRITLRYAGNVQSSTTATQVSMLQPQDHTWYAEYTLNLSKHLPKVLTYPEQFTGAGPTAPLIVNSPTNSGIFMCMGYASWYTPTDFKIEPLNAAIEQTYVSELSYKDI